MKKIKYWLACLFFIPCFLAYSGQERSITYDLGETTVNRKIKRIIEIEKGVVNVVPLCDCIKARILEPNNKKNRTSLLEVVFDPTGYSGQVSEELRLVDENKIVTKMTFTINVIDNR